jgi:hypothetical protein
LLLQIKAEQALFGVIIISCRKREVILYRVHKKVDPCQLSNSNLSMACNILNALIASN